MRAAIATVLALAACACGGDDAPDPVVYAVQADAIASVPGRVGDESGGDLARIGRAYGSAADALRDLSSADGLEAAGTELEAALDAAADAHADAAATGDPEAIERAAEAVRRVTAARQDLLARAAPDVGD